MKTFIVLSVLVAVASAAYKPQPYQQKPATYRPSAPRTPGDEVPILRQAYDSNPDGSYSYSYETGNGIVASESGIGGQSVNGAFQYVGDDGVPVSLQYVADENGFQPQGSHIPQPPPIPEAILRSLEYIRTHPYNEEQQYRKAPVAKAQPAYKPSTFNAKPFNSNNNNNRYNRF